MNEDWYPWESLEEKSAEELRIQAESAEDTICFGLVSDGEGGYKTYERNGLLLHFLNGDLVGITKAK